jgi:hypothetical protein
LPQASLFFLFGLAQKERTKEKGQAPSPGSDALFDAHMTLFLTICIGTLSTL